MPCIACILFDPFSQTATLEGGRWERFDKKDKVILAKQMRIHSQWRAESEDKAELGELGAQCNMHSTHRII